MQPNPVAPYTLSTVYSMSVQLANVSGSATWLSANAGVFVPFRVSTPSVVKNLFCDNGTVASGNVDMGIYTMDGVRLVSAGSTAQAGTTALQIFNIDDTVLGRGTYYLGIALDNTTGTINRSNTLTRYLAPFGYIQKASVFPLPATITFSSNDIGNCGPAIGLTMEPLV